MQITRTIELTDRERLVVANFLNLTDKISDVARCSMDDVFEYFAEKAEITEDGYEIGALHQLSDIGG